MSKRQTRRTVSIARPLYDAASAAAKERGIPLAQFVDEAIRAAGVAAKPTRHADIENVWRAAIGKLKARRAAIAEATRD